MGIVLTLVAVGLAGAVLGYLLWCYVHERRIRNRIKERARRQFGGNIVPACRPALDTRGLPKKSSATLPDPCGSSSQIKLRRGSRHPHPWKRGQFPKDALTPH
jgi:hypothetical protein